MTNWIVCGIEPDKNECSTLQVASRLAATMGARLAVVTAVERVEEPTAQSALITAGRRVLAAATRRCRLPDDTVHRVEAGSPADGLTHAADDLGAAMIVIGETTRPLFARLRKGGVDRQVVRASKRPIVVVPSGAETLFADRDGQPSAVVIPIAAR